MSKVCEICGKAPVAGRNVSHSHRVTNRTFRPNVQKVTVKIDGKVKRANVCTKCMKAGKIERAYSLLFRLPRKLASRRAFLRLTRRAHRAGIRCPAAPNGHLPAVSIGPPHSLIVAENASSSSRVAAGRSAYG